MANSPSAVFFFFVALSFSWIACGQADAEKAHLSPGSQQPVLALDFKNNGQRLAARVGQKIEITLGTVGPKQYGDPQVSSDAIRLESVALDWPANPGGPTFIYVFEATSEGEARVEVPIINCMDDPELAKGLGFSVTIIVGPAAGKLSAMQVLMRPDQANTAPWTGAWTNLFNVVHQTFTPSLPRLTAVEAEMAVANPGPKSADLNLTIMDKEGVALAVVSKTVPVDDCNHVLFILPRGGLPVSPGQVYIIGLNGGEGAFGWKYIRGGYPSGDASFNGQPLLQNARSTFLFRTFGTSWRTRSENRVAPFSLHVN
jgi:hypothetical protein